MDSIVEPSTNGEEVDGGQEVSGKFIKALRETTHILTATEEAFDNIALSVKTLVVQLRMFGVGFIRNDRNSSIISDSSSNMLTVVSFVGCNG